MHFSRQNQPLPTRWIFCEPFTHNGFGGANPKITPVLISRINEIDTG
jgi:hypothetical protein